MKNNIFLTSSLQTVAKDLTKYIKKPAKLAFITTASELKKRDIEWRDLDRQAIYDAGFEIEDYTITGKTKVQIKKYLENVDGIVMEGGNSFYLLQQIQLTKCADIICDFTKSGKYYIGSSAGSIVAGPDIWPIRRLDLLKDAPKIKGYKGLCLVDFVVFPHWGSDHSKQRYAKQWIQNYSLDHKIILLTDNQYIIVDEQSLQIVDVKINHNNKIK